MYQDLPVSKLRESPLNPRKSFDQTKLDELTRSVSEKGVLQPILARPLAGGTFEVVCGHRRFRAAKAAKLKTIPANVREMNDRDALEAQITENEQREDVSPLEKADGYAALVEQHGVAVEQIAARVGKSVSTVRGLLKLRALPERARQALDAGELSTSVAQLIGRVPSPVARERLTWHVLAGEGFWRPDLQLGEHDVANARRLGIEPLTFRATKELVERSLMVELKGSPFSRKALGLVTPETPSCDACPKRTGNCKDDYPDARADVCLDPECYRAKVDAHRQLLLGKARRHGFGAMGEQEALRVFDRDGKVLQWSSWTDIDVLWENGRPVKQQKTYRELVGQQIKAHTLAAVDPKGKLRYVAPSAVVVKALQDGGLISRPETNGHTKKDKPSPGSAEHLDGLADRLGVPREDFPANGTTAPRPPAIRERDVQTRMAQIAGEVMYQMGANNPDGLEGLEEQGDSTTNAAWEALKLLCLLAAEEAVEDGESHALREGVLTLVDDLAGDDLAGDDQDPMKPWQSFIDRAKPAELIGLLLKAATQRVLFYNEASSQLSRKALLDWGELDLEHLKDQARRELTGKPSGQKLEPALASAEEGEE